MIQLEEEVVVAIPLLREGLSNIIEEALEKIPIEVAIPLLREGLSNAL